MKRLFVFVLCLFTGVVYAHTINWYVDDQLYQTTTCTIGDDVTPPTAPTKYGYTFQGWRAYIPIEYIESTGIQYINTGVQPNQDTRVVMEYMASSNFSGFLFGARNSLSSGNRSYGVLYSGDGKLSSDYNERLVIISLSNSFYNQKLICDKYKRQIVVYDQNGNTLGAGANAAATFGPDYALIFPNTQTGTVITYITGSIKIYSFKIYDNGTLVRDFIPVLDTDNVPCMWDLVSEACFYNAGTGEFIAGPEI